MRQVIQTRIHNGNVSFQYVEIDDEGYRRVALRGQRNGPLDSEDVWGWLEYGQLPGGLDDIEA